MGFLKKIQNLNLTQRKFIFWFVIVTLTIGLSISFLKNSGKRLKNLKTDSFLKDFNISDFNQKPEAPWLEEFSEEMKKFDELLKEIEENSTSTTGQQ